ncbi:hypothetical protein [Acinetobacter sp. TSRC1-2]
MTDWYLLKVNISRYRQEVFDFIFDYHKEKGTPCRVPFVALIK